MSQKALEQGFGGRVQKCMDTLVHLLTLEVDGLWRRNEAQARSGTTRLLIGLLGLMVFCLGASGAFLMFKANHLFTSYLLTTSYSKELALQFAILLLFVEAAIIGAFAVQDRRRLSLAMQLRESEDRLEFAAKSADMGMWSWDSETDRFWATDHCQDMFGIARSAEFTMAAMRGAVHPDDLPMVDDALARGAKSGNTFEVECRMNIGAARMRWVRCRACVVRGLDDKVHTISGTIVDITDRKKMAAEVESQRQSLSHLMRVGMIGELSGGLAHELNQPLTAIMSNAQAAQRMIGQTKIDIDELRGAIADIIANDVRAGEVIRHLRALLKKEDMRRERFDLNDAVRATLGLAHSDLITRHVNVSLHPAAQPVFFTGDAIQIQQVVLNLVLNAAEAMGGGGGMLNVSVDLEADGARHICVADTGPGIRGEIMKSVFEPFFSTKAHGLGLGLSISRSIVAAHGGEIWAENNPGRGAAFHVILPNQEETTHADR